MHIQSIDVHKDCFSIVSPTTAVLRLLFYNKALLLSIINRFIYYLFIVSLFEFINRKLLLIIAKPEENLLSAFESLLFKLFFKPLLVKIHTF